ncbi:cation diffusion facilitator family transporter [Mycolicibacterium septicum]|uniref:Cation diffusion facilitator family transporter n=4 Tax=Mycolicibacterium TaxID=1866885 RepID=A0A0J8UC36_9MYCO|nr:MULTISPECIES: cation diffusion facilitator family transporter [Mycolicibacterium]OCB47932.1 cation transporter [Mycolicibacterium vulneris]KMV19108.1 cation transporter [Mycolicibacterium conceptionense]MCV7200642.1 cation transporter [Mycolicibacterium peregrinum]MCW1825088.1 cation diffusion facilitator family transporter [Mycolicibacterium senegalense]NKZ10022.1 cation transporter [Mycolicibacterium septicum DSM 44393]
MGQGQEHGSAVSASAKHVKRLWAALALTGGYLLVELIGGIITGSLALISDAAHMGTDVLGISMALAAIYFARRPATGQRSYGTYRLEVLAALGNGLLLFGVAGYILYEAYERFREPPDVLGVPMLIVAVVGLAVNATSFWLLTAGAKESLNVKGAYLEVLSDMLGSIGVIVAAVIVTVTGWRYADPIVGAAIGLFILPRTAALMREAFWIIMEFAPRGLDVDEVQRKLEKVSGVRAVHDLHVWTLTAGMETATAHIVVAPDGEYAAVLQAVRDVLASEYSITHITMQCEPEGFNETPSSI